MHRLAIGALALLGCSGLGPPCATSAECEPGRVCGYAEELEVADLDPLPLRCRDPGADAPGGCAVVGDCATGICMLGGACAMACVEDADCEAPARCRTAFVRGTDPRLHPAHVCVADLQVAPGVDATSSPVEGGLDSFTELTLEGLAEGSSAYSIVPRDRVYEGNLIPGELTRLESIASGESLLMPVPGRSLGSYPRAAVPSFAIPFGFEGGYSPEGYRMEVVGYESRVDGEPVPTAADSVRTHRTTEGHTLDLDVFFIGPAANDFRLGRFERARGEIDAVFAPADIRLGSVREHHVGGLLARRFFPFETGAFGQFSTQLGELLELSLGAGRASVAVFVIDGPIRLDGCPLGGLSPGIPGAQGIHGTEASGVILSTWVLGPYLALVLVHEIGHFLGLRHTTEHDGFSFDALDDTPECPAALDADFDGAVSNVECAGAGADNVMFWSAAGTAITPGQARVLRSSPLLY